MRAKRNLIICVTGTPGCGKTRLAKRLALEKKLLYVPLNEILKKEHVYERYDKKFHSYVVDERKVREILIGLIKAARMLGQGLIIDSHLSHEVPGRYADECIVVKCDLKTLKKRLKKRRYSERKIRENLDAEILDACLVEAKENGHKVKIVYT